MSLNYWQVKSASLERNLRMQELEAAARQADAAFKAVMEANDLDPLKNYRLTDADECVTEIIPEGDQNAAET